MVGKLFSDINLKRKDAVTILLKLKFNQGVKVTIILGYG